MVKITRYLHACLKETNEQVENKARVILSADSMTMFIEVTHREKMFNREPKELNHE